MDFCDDAAFCAALMEAANGPGQLLPRMNARIVSLTRDGRAEGELTLGKENQNPWGTVHGGALATLADTVAGACAVAATGCVCVTVDFYLNYLRPALGGKVHCAAQAEHIGKTLSVVQVRIRDEQGKALATGQFTLCRTGPLEGAE
ncbi:MAG: PaaI family thioesterase [Oscillospiraceae bacterium]|nr:PaaI family thioesterase [Oscillospiraceae bacterium]